MGNTSSQQVMYNESKSNRWTDAIEKGSLDIVRMFIAMGINIDLQDDNGSTALASGSLLGNFDIVQALLERNAKVDIPNNKGFTALIFASQKGHLEIVWALLERNAKVDLQNNNGDTALIFASTNGHLEIVKALLERSAKVDITNNNRDTALIFASTNGHLEIVKALLERSANVDITNKDMDTALIFASRNGHLGVVKVLLERSTKVDTQNNKGFTALIYASKNGRFTVVKALLERDAKVDIQNKNGDTALIVASQNGHIGVVKALLERHAKIDIRNKNGDTAFIKASKHVHLGVTKVLENQSQISCIKERKNKIQTESKSFHESQGSIREQMEIVKGRGLLREIMANSQGPYRTMALPIEYIQLCTENFGSKYKLDPRRSGEVYLAEDKFDDNIIQFVAKRVRVSDIQASNVNMFRREVEALQRLRHPNIVRLFGTSKDDKYDILLLEYVNAGALSVHLRSEAKRQEMTARIRVSVLSEVARALHFLHHGGIIDDKSKQKYSILHRDIKSSNICLDSNYNAKLIDCGMAKFDVVMEGGMDQNLSLAKTLIQTRAHHIMGTAGYLCPQYAHGYTSYRAECDVYSFGVVMLELLVGSVQGEGGDLVLKYKTREDITARIDKLAGAVWNCAIPQLTKLALQCVAYNMEDRPTFGQISSQLSLIQMQMTGCLNFDYDDDNEEDEEEMKDSKGDVVTTVVAHGSDKSNSTLERQLTCCLCSKICSENHRIICRYGHIMDSNCCRDEIVSFVGKRECTDEFRCPLCLDRIGLLKLRNKVPYEYICMLEKCYEDTDFRQRLLALEGRIVNVEAQQVNLEAAIQKMSQQYVSIWQYLSNAALNERPCPRYVIIEPATDELAGGIVLKKRMKMWTHKKMTVYFLCEHSWQRVKAFDQMMPRDWVVQVAPVVSFTMTVIAKSFTCGILDTSIVTDHEWLKGISDRFSQLVDKKVDDFNRKLSDALVKASNNPGIVPKEAAKKFQNDKVVMNILDGAYSALADEAQKHDVWKNKLCSIVSPEHGQKWVKREYAEKATMC